MGYNVWQTAYTPCQIGIMHSNISRLKGRGRKFVVPNWCQLHPKGSITIRDSIVWLGEKDLYGHLTIAEGATLELKCRTSFPKGAKLIVKPGATLILNNARLHNSCGDQWEGIELQERNGVIGKVIEIGEPSIEDV